MFVEVRCDCESCYCNEDGECVADMGIELVDGECATYEPKEPAEG